jgi:hypothetical protein
MSELIETITVGDKPLVMIVKGAFLPPSTQFLTPDSYNQQIGYIVYPAGGVIKRHHHLPVERHLSVTSEVLIVRQGKAIADIYDDDKNLVASREVQTGDVMVLLAGGHGFRIVEPTVFLEIKQGPYMGVKDKVLF